jgi:hypothetical protein
VIYSEDRCALRWPLVGLGLAAPAAVMVAFIGLAVTVTLLWLIAVPLVPLFGPFLIYGGLLYRNWPTGIRIDSEGIRIGAVSSDRAARRTPTVTHQNWGLFSCPWPAVTNVNVITDAGRIRAMRNDPQYYTLANRWGKPRTMTRCMIGVLAAPFARSVLVIDVDMAQAQALGITVPTTRTAFFFPNQPGRPAVTKLRPEPSSTWVVPTRRPEALRQALQTHRVS